MLKSRTQRMVHLLNDLLMYSRIDRYEYAHETFDLKTTVDEIFSLLDAPSGYVCNSNNIKIALPRIPVEIILRNLISNAVKHHDKEVGSIDVYGESSW